MILDNDLIFDKETKRYYLTENYVLNKLGTDISLYIIDETDVNLSTLNERVIKEACDELYEYIEENAVYPESTLYDFTQRKGAHQAIKKALGLQLLYFLHYGDASFSAENGNNFVVNTRALRVLDSKSCFHIKYLNIPDDVNKW